MKLTVGELVSILKKDYDDDDVIAIADGALLLTDISEIHDETTYTKDGDVSFCVIELA